MKPGLWKSVLATRFSGGRPLDAVHRLAAYRPSSIVHAHRYASVVAADNVKPPSAPPEPAQPGPVLRGYQEDCIQSILVAIREDRRQVGVSLATGSGKTVIFANLIGRVPPPTPLATKTLILVHRQELVEQAAKHCRLRYPQYTVEIEMGNTHASGTADITVASIQSITSRDRIDKFDPDTFKLILVDEAHHVVAPTYLRALEHFGLQKDTESTTLALVGFSATFSRFDGLALSKAIKHIVYHKDYVDMIEEGWLSNVLFTTVESRADVSNVKRSGGDFHLRELSEAVNTEEINLITVRSWLTRARERKSTLVFCVDVDHIERLTAMFRRHGIDARYITGATKRATRSATLDAFKNREFPVLLNCGVFTEGTDIPNVDCVVLARPTQSRNLLIQMIGRGMRLYPGKENCHIIDMVASLETGIVTTPTLFGLDPSEMLNSAEPGQLKKLREKREEEKAKAKPEIDPSTMLQTTNRRITFTDYDSVTDLISDTAGEHSIRALSTNAWVNVDTDKYVLTNGSRGAFLTLESSEPADALPRRHWLVKFTAKNVGYTSTAPYYRPRNVARSETFEAAVRAADTYAAKAMTHVFTTRVGPLAAWRKREATQGQVDFLNKLRGEDEQWTTADVTRGRAADMVTKIKFGAKGRWARVSALKRQMVKKESKVSRMRERQRGDAVSVGPLVG